MFHGTVDGAAVEYHRLQKVPDNVPAGLCQAVAFREGYLAAHLGSYLLKWVGVVEGQLSAHHHI